ncbi:hypothetical protein BDFB_009049 [Asbolus verrucosus]|uniref:Uncharacterized protein n=1 Tax=Asbolus verrucosus TaxID=1661398 RepID=A0A482VDP5_ASBVE|nr:hypothetical protein BDFB_009049 [Asbolus verrucosus]
MKCLVPVFIVLVAVTLEIAALEGGDVGSSEIDMSGRAGDGALGTGSMEHKGEIVKRSSEMEGHKGASVAGGYRSYGYKRGVVKRSTNGSAKEKGKETASEINGARRRVSRRGKIPHPRRGGDDGPDRGGKNNDVTPKEQAKVVESNNGDERENRNGPDRGGVDFLKMSMLSPLFDVIFGNNSEIDDSSSDSESDEDDDDGKTVKLSN